MRERECRVEGKGRGSKMGEVLLQTPGL